VVVSYIIIRRCFSSAVVFLCAWCHALWMLACVVYAVVSSIAISHFGCVALLTCKTQRLLKLASCTYIVRCIYTNGRWRAIVLNTGFVQATLIEYSSRQTVVTTRCIQIMLRSNKTAMSHNQLCPDVCTLLH
jgi:beta-lactamase superfamily II metal-dependent hydrolase